MKTIHNVILSLLLFSTVSAFGQYKLVGDIQGAADGMKVFLKTANTPEPKIIDSTMIRRGKFTFTGKVALPAKYAIVIDKTKIGQKSSQRNWLMSDFYLENSVISYEGHIDSLPGYYAAAGRVIKRPVITGSKAQDLLEEFNKSISPLTSENGKLYGAYMKDYHLPSIDGKFNTEMGVRLVKKMNIVAEAIKKATWQFIRTDPQTVVAYDKALENFQGMYVMLTINEIDSLVAIVERGWKGTKHMIAFKDAAAIARKTAIGVKYQDIPLTDIDGNKVGLSKYVTPGKYTMLEFWASWCGPCRGEIPHLKDVVRRYKNKDFVVVSISIDEREGDWKKAMKEEGMDWIQLNDRAGFVGPACKTYNILGVPFCLVLDKEGRIFKTDMRGAELDAVLEELFPETTEKTM